MNNILMTMCASHINQIADLQKEVASLKKKYAHRPMAQAPRDGARILIAVKIEGVKGKFLIPCRWQTGAHFDAWKSDFWKGDRLWERIKTVEYFSDKECRWWMPYDVMKESEQ
jgi:hypothetical protein